MKKLSLLLAFGGVLALSGCTSSEENDVGIQSNTIGFEHLVNGSSRAVVGDLTNANLDKFLVYGYFYPHNQSANPVQVFSGDVVTKENGAWTYKNVRYWVPDASYYFYAYSCGDIALDNSLGNVNLYINAIDQKDRELRFTGYHCDATHQHDLVYAEDKNHFAYGKPESGSATANTPVTFNFKHILAKINVKFVSEFVGDYDVYISEVNINNFYNRADYTPSSSSWANHDRVKPSETMPIYITLPFSKEGDVTIEDTKNNLANSTKTPLTKYVYMLPREYKHPDVQLKFKIDVFKNGESVMSRELTGDWRPDWKPGYAYTYTVKITGSAASLEPIVFQTATDMNLDQWGAGTSTTETDITFSAN